MSGYLTQKVPAEAAADIGRRELGKRQPVNAREQAPGLDPDPEFAQARTRIVVGDRPLMAGVHLVEPH